MLGLKDVSAMEIRAAYRTVTAINVRLCNGVPVPYGITVADFLCMEHARNVMQCDWMTQYGLAQAIPPAYTEYIGRHLLEAIGVRVAA